MSEIEYRILEILNRDNSLNQRDIARSAGVSLGKVNYIIKLLVAAGYLNLQRTVRRSLYLVSDKGLQALESYIQNTIGKKIVISNNYKNVNTAVILAAGECSDFEKPVGFLQLGDTTVIENAISLLNHCGINKIIIVTGYESRYYEELAKRKSVLLVKNTNYKWNGTMSSLALAQDLLSEDFLLLESDVVFEERAITEVLKNGNRNCVLITGVSGSGDEVFVELKNDFIHKMSKDKHQFNSIDGEMIGISKISIDIYKKMLEQFSTNKNPYFSYEYALLDVGRTYDIGYVKIEDLIWTEIDTIWHYKNLVNYIYPMLVQKNIRGRKE